MQEDPSFKPVDDISDTIDVLQSSAFKTFFLPLLTVIINYLIVVLEYLQYSFTWFIIW